MASNKIKKFKKILEDVEAPGYFFDISDSEIDFWLQVTDGHWKGRKWRLSVHMTASELVQTALLAVLTFAEHELRENFRYKGEKVFAPHFDLDNQVDLMKSGTIFESFRS